MVVRNFGGPAGQMEDPDTNGPRRQPSQPEIISDGNHGSARRELPITSGLNLLTVGGAIGRDYRSPLTPTTASKSGLPSGANSSSCKLLPSSRVPRYNLKTIPPKSPNPVGGHLRPSARHVPGSYRSEVVPSPAGSLRVSTPALDNRSVSEDQRFDEDFSYFGINPETHSAAVDYLKQATTLAASYPASTMREIPPVEQAHDIRPAETVLTLGMDHEHSHGTSSVTSSAVPESDHKVIEEEGLAHNDATSGFLHEQAQDDIVPYARQSTLPCNGPQISELLSQLPPVSRISIHDLGDQQLTTKPSTQSLSSVGGSHSGHKEQNPLSNAGERKIHQHRSTDILSTISQKLSSVGKSISSLSETSLRSDPKLPSSHTSGKQEKFALVNGGPRKYWMQQMLAKASGSTTPVGPSSLTARPNHGQKHAVEAAVRPRTASIPTRELPTMSTDEALLALHKQKDTESFARVIVNLESLLQEALIIAHQAAGEGHSHGGHALNLDSDNSSRYTLERSDGSSTISGGNDEEDNATTLPRRLPLRISISPNGAYDVERRDLKQDLSENARPEATSGLHVYSLQDTPESSQSIAHEALPSKPCPDSANAYSSHDWAYQPVKQKGLENEVLCIPRRPTASHTPTQEQRVSLVRARKESPSIASGDTVRHHVNARQAPPIQPRVSSLGLRSQARRNEENHPQKVMEVGSSDEDTEYDPYIADFDDPENRYQSSPQSKTTHKPQSRSGPALGEGLPRHDTIMPLPDRNDQPVDSRLQDEQSTGDNVSLTNRHHFSIREPKGFSLSRSHRRAPIARDWSTPRKRWVATVACISTALMGLIIGIYAGEVPAIQYAIVDEHHYTILGNVVFFIGLAITTALFWPLPLLHGRKPYTLAALAILLPLQFPQAIAVSTQRSPYVATYRVALLLPRAISGLIMGFANINFKSTLLDLFGASLQSVHPHQEVVKINDVRRHGGGMGIWLGIWTWCYIGSLGLGFLIGAVVISSLSVTWGFWITIILIAAVLVLNVLTPEVRRSAYRRSMAEVRTATDISRRVARGEVKMHLQSTGPIWWWEEVWAGHVLCVRMLKQPGFAVLSLYLGWIYGQVVIVIVLLGALLSKYYHFHPQYVGLCVGAIPVGALLAVPFQKASLFSRSRKTAPRTDSMTFEKRVSWTSHLVRRAIFMIVLPFAGLAYTLGSGGPQIHFMVPTIFAGLIGFLSNLAIAECNGIIMETFDTSDLQPGMTGRPRNVLPEEVRKKRTNFSCYPRVTAAFAISQTFAFLIAAAATGAGGAIERRLGDQTATAVVAGILLLLTLLLIAVLTRFKVVQVIPTQRYGTAVLSGPEDEWKPVIIGNPSGTTRRISILELGKLSRWSEIRRRNKLLDEGGS